MLTVAFAGQLPFAHIVTITLFNYGYKLVIAIVITPLIYFGHWGIDRYLGDETAEALIAEAEQNAVGVSAP